MHHIKQSDIAIELRQPHIRAERRRIQEALRYGGHSDQHRAFLQYQLSLLGKPRVYSGTAPHPPGAIDLPVNSADKVSLDGATYFSLSKHTLSDLIRKAESLGIELPEPTTKPQVVKILLSNGETP